MHTQIDHTIQNRVITLEMLRKSTQLTESNRLLDNFLELFKDKKKEYTLSPAELFSLIETIIDDSKRNQISFISHPLLCLLFTMHFLEIYVQLHLIGFPNKENFKSLYALSSKQLTTLNTIFVNPHEEITLFQIQSIMHLVSLLASNTLISIKKMTGTILLNNHFQLLLTFSDSSLIRLHTALHNLKNSGILTPKTLNQTLDRMSSKIHNVAEITVLKKSRKNIENNLLNSQFTLNYPQGELTFFIQHHKNKEYPQGSMGRVKKGYEGNQHKMGKPTWAVKMYHNTPEAAEGARKNAKYQALMGRASYFYKRNGLYSTVYPWQNGKQLYKFKTEQVIEIPFINRLICLISGLSQLESLHSRFCTHNDLNALNYIVDFSQNIMALIDFDKTTKSTESDCQDEVEAMSVVVKYLFPKISDLKSSEKHLNPNEYAIVLLISAMSCDNPKQRCTTKTALNFCQELLQKCNSSDTSLLTHDSINSLAQKTITKNTLDFEDALRGKTCLMR